MPALAGSYFLVTGSGKFFRNVQLSPADSLTLLQLNEDGTGYRILWRLIAGGLPTSELATHLQSHAVRKQVTGGGDRVIMHCHATNLIALSYVLELDTAEKSAEVMVKVRSMGGKKHTISRAELVAFGERFGVTPMAAALNVEAR